MRCYFMRGGHIAAIELLNAKSDEEAIQQCQALFEERKSKFEALRFGTKRAKSLTVRLVKTTHTRVAREAAEVAAMSSPSPASE